MNWVTFSLCMARSLMTFIVSAMVLSPCSWAVADSRPLTVGFFPDHIFSSRPETAALYQEVLFFKQIGQTLVESGRSDELVPGLAEQWIISPDRKKYIFSIRKGIKFQDGSPLSANDVVDSLNRAIYGKANSLPFYFSNLKGFQHGFKLKKCPGLKVINAVTVEMDLDKPYSPLLKTLTSGLTAIFKKDNSKVPGVLCGTGPYKIVKGEKGNELLANDFYQGIYPPSVQTIKILTDSEVLYGSKKTLTTNLPDFDVFIPTDFLSAYKPEDYTITRTPHLATAGFYPNVKSVNCKTAEQRRQMLAPLLKIVAEMNKEVSTRIPGLVLTDLYPKGMLAHNPARTSWTQFREQLSDVSPSQMPKTVRVGAFGTIMADTDLFTRLFKQMTNSNLEIVHLDSSHVIESLAHEKFDVLFMIWHSVVSDPHAQISALELLNSFSAEFNQKPIRALIDESVEKTVDSVRVNIYNKIADFVFENALFLPAFQRDHVTALKRGWIGSPFIYRYQPMFSEIRQQ